MPVDEARAATTAAATATGIQAAQARAVRGSRRAGAAVTAGRLVAAARGCSRRVGIHARAAGVRAPIALTTTAAIGDERAGDHDVRSVEADHAGRSPTATPRAGIGAAVPPTAASGPAGVEGAAHGDAVAGDQDHATAAMSAKARI